MPTPSNLPRTSMFRRPSMWNAHSNVDFAALGADTSTDTTLVTGALTDTPSIPVVTPVPTPAAVVVVPAPLTLSVQNVLTVLMAHPLATGAVLVGLFVLMGD